MSEKESLMRRMLMFGAIALALLLLGLAAGCDNGPSPSPSPAAQITPPPPSDGVTPYRGSLQVGDWTLGTQGFKRYEFLPAGKGGATDLKPTNGAFGAVLLSATNRGAAPALLKLADFQLLDGSGHIFKVDEKATLQYSGEKQPLSAIDQPIPPGETRQVGIVFDLPPTTYAFVLQAMGGKIDPGPFPEK